MQKRERTLTLVETLLIVGIVAVLGGLALNTFDERDELRRAKICVGRLRQLHTAFTMYLEDHNGVFPSNLPQTRKYFGWEYPWPEQINPYLKDRRAFRCPDDKSDIAPETDSYRPWGHFTSYVMNQAIGWDDKKVSSGVVKRLSDIPSPSNTMLLVDREPWHFRGSRRNTIRNVLFVDGGVVTRSDDVVRDTYWGQIGRELPREGL